MVFGRSLTEARLISSANYVRTELPTRYIYSRLLAHIDLKAMQVGAPNPRHADATLRRSDEPAYQPSLRALLQGL